MNKIIRFATTFPQKRTALCSGMEGRFGFSKALVKAAFLSILLFANVSMVICQSSLVAKARATYEIGDYARALPLLQQAFDRFGDFSLCEPLAMCHFRQGNANTALVLWNLATVAGKCSDSAMLYQAKAELQLGRYPQVRRRLAAVPRELMTSHLFDSLTSCLNLAADLFKDSLLYRIIPVNIPNWELSMCPQWHEDGLLFCGAKAKNRAKSSQMQVAYAKRLNLFSFESPQSFDPMAYEGYQDGPAVVAPSQRRIFFTRTYDKFPDPENRMAKGSLSRILMVEKKGGKWSPTTELNLNSWQFSNAHPTLAENDSTMVFVSNRPGGKGGADLYLVCLGLGGWEVPINLGPTINTPGNEFFPTLVGPDTLYFASDGHPGLGGLDMYITWKENGQWRVPINLGYPVNSNKDDFGIHLLRKQGISYISSNRGQSGNEAIYAAMYAVRASVVVLDEGTRKPLLGATIRRIDRGGLVRIYTTDAQGMALIDLEMNGGANIEVEADDYLARQTQVSNLQCLPGVMLTHKVVLAPAYAAKVTGKIFANENGLPVAGVQVRASYAEGGTQYNAITNPQGEYQIELPVKGRVYLVFEKVGMRTSVTSLDLNLAADRTIVHDVRMDAGQTQLIMVTVQDQVGRPIQDGTIEIRSGATKRSLVQTLTNEKGMAVLALEWEADARYSLFFSRSGYAEQCQPLPNEYSPGPMQVRFDIAEHGQDRLLKVAYYGSNQTNLPDFSRQEIQAWTDAISESPGGVIEIRSYTDALGKARYNQRLSERRANAIRKYLISRFGIPAKQIVARGFGERFLVNECDDYHPCDSFQHGQNRRSEIWLIVGHENL
jgi:outer membrane protein OmpA-like peptidoglycan-associated protein